MGKQTPPSKPVEAYTPPAAPAAAAGAPVTTVETATTTETAGAPATTVEAVSAAVDRLEGNLTAEEAAALAQAATVPEVHAEAAPKAKRLSHVVASRQATTTLRGILGEGEPVELRDFLNQQSFDKMVELGVIVPSKDE